MAKPTANHVPPLVVMSSSDNNANVELWANPTTHRLLVDASTSPSGTQDVNLTQVGGATFALGQQLAAASLPIVLTAAQITTLTPPAAITGFATSAKQDTLLTELQLKADLTETQPVSLATVPSHAVTNAGTFVVQENGAALTALQLIDNAVSGSGFNITQVNGETIDVGAGTETAAIRVTLPTNGTGILAGVTTVTTLTGTTTLTPGTGATNLGKAEDGAHTSGDVGVFSLGVRADTLADVSGATGDYTQMSVDLKGRVMVGSAPRTLKANQITTITSSVAETTIVTAVASTFLDLYGIIITNTSATAVNVAIKDGTAGTTRFNIAVPAADTRGFMLPIDGAMKQSGSNANWTATSSASVASLVITALTVANL